MFDKQTVLILGAGASCHYGYPTGEELVERIIERTKDVEYEVEKDVAKKNRLSPPSHQDRRSCDLGLYAEYVNLLGELRQLLESLHPLNIDSFLLYNERYAPLAKTLIADILLECNVEKPTKDKNWYRYLFHALTYGCKVDAQDTAKRMNIEQSIGNLTIITFNYDTSLERHLRKAFQSVQAFKDLKDENDPMNLIKGKIYHVYGKLADEDFYDLSPEQQKAKRSDIVRASAKNIDVIAGKKHQELRDDCQSTLQKLDNVIKQGGRLVILGYGFDPENNKLIGLTPPTGGYILHQTDPSLRFSYTNFRDSQRIERKFAPNKQNQALKEPWRFEKSTKTVAEALQQDFDLT
ncbi:MAG: hypothetical protein ACK5O1_01010 [Holosporales bacterium]|jgi:hypothetical protein